MEDIYKKAGQEHVYKYKDVLTNDELKELDSELSLYKDGIIELSKDFKDVTSKKEEKENIYKPFPNVTNLDDVDEKEVLKWKNIGLDLIRKGKLGILLLAGGQGTRLGFNKPKGCYNLGFNSNKTLFQYQAERIKRLIKLAKQKNNNTDDIFLPWYIMTSGPTHDDTVNYFKSVNNFGLKDIIFFSQTTLPCFNMEGKIVLKTKSSLSHAPNGNGGIYKALYDNNIVETMKKNGTESIYTYCVDNAIVKVGDPIFVGYCYDKKAQCGNKVVPKAYPKEKVGVVCLKNGKCGVVEYSELSEEMAGSVDENGKPVFNEGNIAIHYYSVDFLDKLRKFKLPYHVAKKQIPTWNEEKQQTIKPAEKNGIKLEMFIFDVQSEVAVKDMAVLSCDRKFEFAPVKNAPGKGLKDSPDTAKELMSNFSKFCLKAAGVENKEEGLVEISPLDCYDQYDVEDLKKKA